jgi:hypothetical protein
MFTNLQNLKNLENILTRLVQSTCQNANIINTHIRTLEKNLKTRRNA